MTTQEASSLILEMLQEASKRGVFSRIELKAIQEAVDIVQKPLPDKAENP